MKDLCLPAEAAIDKAMLTYDPEEQIDGPDPITVVTRTNDGTVLDVATVDIDESAWVTDSTVSTTPLTSQGEQVVSLPNLCNNVYVTVNVPLIKRLAGAVIGSLTTDPTGMVPLTNFTYTSVAISSVSIPRYSTYFAITVSDSVRNIFQLMACQANSVTVNIPAKTYYFIYSAGDTNARQYVSLFVLDANNLTTPVYYMSLCDINRTDSSDSPTYVSKSVLLVSTD